MAEHAATPRASGDQDRCEHVPIDHLSPHEMLDYLNRRICLSIEAKQDTGSRDEAGPDPTRFDMDKLRRMASRAAKLTTFPFEIKDRGMAPLIQKGAIVGVNTQDRQFFSGRTYLLQFPPIKGLTLPPVVRKVYHGPEVGIFTVKGEDPLYTEPPMSAQFVLDAIVGRIVWVMQPLDRSILGDGSWFGGDAA